MEDLLRGAAPLKDQLDPQFSTLDDDHPDGYEENAVGPTAASLEDLGWYLCSQGDLDKDASCGDGVSDVDDLNPTARKQLDISGRWLYTICFIPAVPISLISSSRWHATLLQGTIPKWISRCSRYTIH